MGRGCRVGGDAGVLLSPEFVGATRACKYSGLPSPKQMFDAGCGMAHGAVSAVEAVPGIGAPAVTFWFEAAVTAVAPQMCSEQIACARVLTC